METHRIRPEHNLVPVNNKFLKKIFRIIYYSDTPGGKIFDIILLILIVISTMVIMLETVPAIDILYHRVFFYTEAAITTIFTIEYLLRILSVKNKEDYILSPLGLLDVLSLVPFYLGMVYPDLHYFMIFRMLRLLRIFRIFNLADYMNDGHYIVSALKESSRKIYVFLLFMIIFITIIGAAMHVVEGGSEGFTSIPQSIYWAVVTITTVGYGDATPSTAIGKFLSILVMLAGYSIIAVPTGIVTARFREQARSCKACPRCQTDNDLDAVYCKKCSEKFVN
ncbi:ion transporter [Cruoricaptor ignavus]|uniref:Ion transporter n=1 Tax=Cruoricaptor ignavus TaxID=1118202 RepID=A0A7M1T381_9FLAO|nr:ion transporter [Cruoricaptor ignavus]QOR74328.1 ion transporter [Cruoricaptor ignavus]